jgi:hypothetical protein
LGKHDESDVGTWSGVNPKKEKKQRHDFINQTNSPKQTEPQFADGSP